MEAFNSIPVFFTKMKLQHDTLTQSERLECVLNHEEPDRIPQYINGMPEYSEFYQELMEREDELLGDDLDFVLTPSGDFSVDVLFGADIINRIGNIKQPRPIWIDDNDNYINESEVEVIDGKKIGRFIDRSGRLMKSM